MDRIPVHHSKGRAGARLVRYARLRRTDGPHDAGSGIARHIVSFSPRRDVPSCCMSFAEPSRPSFDRKARELLWARWWTWVVNALAIALLPAIVIATRKEEMPVFVGPEVSGFVSGILLYTTINLVYTVTVRVLQSLSRFGRWDYWFAIVIILVFVALSVWDTYLQAAHGVSLFGDRGWIWLLCGIGLSLSGEAYIAVVLRDVEDGVDYTIIINRNCPASTARISPPATRRSSWRGWRRGSAGYSSPAFSPSREPSG